MVKAVNITRSLYRKIKKAFGLEFEVGKVKLGPGFSVESPCVLSAAIDLRSNVSVGAFTYASPTDGIGRFIHSCDIGRYCSIAAGVWVAPEDHPTEWLTSSPMCYNPLSFAWPNGARKSFRVHQRPFTAVNRVTIGNDVWLAHDAFIRQGVKIGDGAIVAAGAVVVKDVPPYAIVGGVPAKVLKYRFDEATIKELLELKWWDYDIADFGEVNWDDIHSAIATIKAKIAAGVKPYVGRKITNADFKPYSRSKPFCFEISKKWIRIKLFGLWIVHKVFN